MANDYKSAKLEAAKMDETLQLDSFTFKGKVKVVAIKHCDGSYLEFHSAHCHRHESKEFYFVFTEHHGYHIYHKDDISCIMKWHGDFHDSKAKIVYKNWDL